MKGVKFLRRNWFRHKRLGMKWRRPRGSQNKLRKEKKGKGRVPKIGWKRPESERGLVPYKGSMVRPVLVRSPSELTEETKHVIVSSTVGTRKLYEIYLKAKNLGIEIVNRKRLASMFRRLKSLKSRADGKPGSSKEAVEEGGSNES